MLQTLVRAAPLEGGGNRAVRASQQIAAGKAAAKLPLR
jgi:hypothetical protein